MGISAEIQDIEAICWKNEDNINYYENIPTDILRGYAIIGGFEEGCDVDLIEPYILRANSILEAGAGYGRVLRHILRKGYTGKLCAVERSKNFFTRLKKEFGDKVEVIQRDIQKFNPTEKFDLVLCLWSYISEFPKEDQLNILLHLSCFLNPNGVIILDTLLHTVAPKNVVQLNQSYIARSEYGTAYGYTPSAKEIHRYAQKLGFENIKHIEYKTQTQRQRIIHILSH